MEVRTISDIEKDYSLVNTKLSLVQTADPSVASQIYSEASLSLSLSRFLYFFRSPFTHSHSRLLSLLPFPLSFFRSFFSPYPPLNSPPLPSSSFIPYVSLSPLSFLSFLSFSLRTHSLPLRFSSSLHHFSLCTHTGPFVSPEEVVSRLIQVGMFDRAIDTAQCFKLPLDSIFEVLASRYIHTLFSSLSLTIIIYCFLSLFSDVFI